MYDYPRHLMASLAHRLLQPPITPIKRHLIRQLLPYAFVIVPGETTLATVLPLNREHKPIGWPCARRGYVDYASDEFSSLRVDVAPVDLFENTTRVDTDEHGTFFYLYGKTTAPPWESFADMMRYAERLTAILGISSIDEGGAV